MEPDGNTPAETQHEPVAANPFGGTPPWQRRGGWKRGLAGVGALVLTIGAIVGVTYLAFRDNTGGEPEPDQVVSEQCRVTAADDAEPTVTPPQLGTPERQTVVLIETNYGNMEAMLFGDVAPCGVEAFLYLAESGFYAMHDCDHLTTQRVHPTAILHCGSPGATPASEPAEETYGPGWRFRAEVGMAGVDVVDPLALVTDENGAGGSAFTLIRGEAVPTAGISVIGQIIDGYEVLDAIAALPQNVEHDEAPPEPVTIYGITVQQGTGGPEASTPDSGTETLQPGEQTSAAEPEADEESSPAAPSAEAPGADR